MLKRICIILLLGYSTLSLISCTRSIKLSLRLLNLIEPKTQGLKISFSLWESKESHCTSGGLRVFDSLESYPGTPIYSRDFHNLKRENEILLPLDLKRPYYQRFFGCDGFSSWLYEPDLLSPAYRWQFDETGLLLVQHLISHDNEIGDDALEIRKSGFCDEAKYNYEVTVNDKLIESRYKQCNEGCRLKLSADFEKGVKFTVSIIEKSKDTQKSKRKYNAYVTHTEQVTLKTGC